MPSKSLDRASPLIIHILSTALVALASPLPRSVASRLGTTVIRLMACLSISAVRPAGFLAVLLSVSDYSRYRAIAARTIQWIHR